jgi:hypothetical protein
MKRVVMVFLMIILTLSSLHGVAGQTELRPSEAFSLPVNLRILRIRAGNGYVYGTDDSGGIAYRNRYIMDDGEMVSATRTALRVWYHHHGVQDLYISRAELVPEVAAPETLPVIVETRLSTHSTPVDAESMVSDYVDLSRGATRDLSPIRNPPEHHGAIVGMIGRGQLDDPIRGGPRRFERSFVRFVAQHDTLVLSVTVASPDPVFNEAVARELLVAQLACLEQNDMCVPLPLPATTETAPGASPVALAPDRRLVTARFRA